MRYFLIANNPRLSNDFIDSLNINDNDIIVLFNHHFPIKFERIKFHPNKYLIMRKVYRIFLGQKEYMENQKYFKDVYSFMKKNIFFNIFKNMKFLDIHYYIGLENLNIIYPPKKLPSTGFVGFIYYYNLLSENDLLYLVGFDGVYNGKLTNTASHDFIFEQHIYKNFSIRNKIKFINPSIISNVPAPIIIDLNEVLPKKKLVNNIQKNNKKLIIKNKISHSKKKIILNTKFNKNEINKSNKNIFVNKPIKNISLNKKNKDISLNNPIEDISINNIIEDISLNNPNEDISINNPIEDISINNPIEDISINNPNEDISVNNPIEDISVNKPIENISINNPIEDISVNKIKNTTLNKNNKKELNKKKNNTKKIISKIKNINHNKIIINKNKPLTIIDKNQDEDEEITKNFNNKNVYVEIVYRPFREEIIHWL